MEGKGPSGSIRKYSGQQAYMQNVRCLEGWM